jgi:CysZ protein
MFKDLVAGITSYSEALQLMSRHRLWGYAVVPGLLTTLLGAAIFYTAWVLSDNLGGLISNLWPWDWGAGVVDKIAQVFGGLLILVLGLIIFKQLIMAISAPFMSLLSEKAEDALRGHNSGKGFTIKRAIYELARGLSIAIRNLIRELLITIVLLLVGLIPLLSPITAVLIILIQSYYFGFGNMDFTLERHLRYRESIRFVNRYRWLAIGNGIIFLLLLLTFVGFLVALPLSTVAAAIESLKRLEAQADAGA